jgi:hypothetical protein
VSRFQNLGRSRQFIFSNFASLKLVGYSFTGKILKRRVRKDNPKVAEKTVPSEFRNLLTFSPHRLMIEIRRLRVNVIH